MFETSKDILNLSIAGGVGLIAIFICWAMYYMIGTLRNVSKMTLSIREKLELVDNILKLIKDKLEKGSNHMAMLSDSAIKLVGFMMDQKEKKNAKSKKTKSKK